MKRSTGAILLVIGLFVLFVALNFVFFVDREEQEEDETMANRSSYRTTPYGTHAFFTLLEESGYDVARFDQPLTDLPQRPGIRTLFIVSPALTTAISREEFDSLKQWTEAGGLLILVDRDITIDWSPQLRAKTFFPFGSPDVKPVQPTIYTKNVKEIGLSRMATRVKLESNTATYHIADASGGVVADATFGKGRVLVLTEPFVIA